MTIAASLPCARSAVGRGEIGLGPDPDAIRCRASDRTGAGNRLGRAALEQKVGASGLWLRKRLGVRCDRVGGLVESGGIDQLEGKPVAVAGLAM